MDPKSGAKHDLNTKLDINPLLSTLLISLTTVGNTETILKKNLLKVGKSNQTYVCCQYIGQLSINFNFNFKQNKYNKT